MNYIWGIMMLVGIIYGTLTGRVDAVSEAVLSSSKEAVTLCITMLGVMALWTGLMEIAKDGGLIHLISKWIRPFIQFLFPDIPEGHPALEKITLNFVANFLGLGWAATPAGLQTMEELAKLEEERRGEARHVTGMRRGEEERHVTGMHHGEEWHVTGMHHERELGNRQAGRKLARAMPRGVASNEMCTFLILNISSLQLIPVNVIAYRAQYGSVNPTAIVGPGIVATAVSTAVAVVFCKIMDRKRRA